MKKIVMLAGLCLILSGLWADADSYKTNNSITFQGYLADSNTSLPYKGTVSMGFRFYDAATNGSKFITDRRARSVPVFNGNYSTKISFSDDEIKKLNGEDDIWIEVYVDRLAGSDPYQTGNKLNPRIQLNAVPYALSVRGVYYDSANDVVMLGSNYAGATVGVGTMKGGLLVQGRVGIGTENPEQQLHVNGNVRVLGNVIDINGRVSATQIYGAVWN
ncbi:MAG: hypothetical protein LBQ83_06540 [Candidatus Margulisbacteria bacterium]|jgi:hypothetical protein|nr:hypothetical protein [Candidatus Margulisiibacteriota bacterium]